MSKSGMLCMHAAFQQMEVDYYVGAPDQSMFRTDLQEVPILRMYGVTEQGARSTASPAPCCFTFCKAGV